MHRGGVISGKILNSADGAYSNLSVQLRLYSSIDGFQTQFVRNDLSGKNPLRYRLDGLPAGVYRLSVQSDSYGPLYTEYYPDELEIGQAADILVDVGTETPEIDLVLGQNRNYATMSGRVTAGDGSALSGIKVTMARDSGSTWMVEREVTTDPTGVYEASNCDRALTGSVSPMPPTSI